VIALTPTIGPQQGCWLLPLLRVSERLPPTHLVGGSLCVWCNRLCSRPEVDQAEHPSGRTHITTPTTYDT